MQKPAAYRAMVTASRSWATLFMIFIVALRVAAPFRIMEFTSMEMDLTKLHTIELKTFLAEMDFRHITTAPTALQSKLTT